MSVKALKCPCDAGVWMPPKASSCGCVGTCGRESLMGNKQYLWEVKSLLFPPNRDLKQVRALDPIHAPGIQDILPRPRTELSKSFPPTSWRTSMSGLQAAGWGIGHGHYFHSIGLQKNLILRRKFKPFLGAGNWSFLSSGSKKSGWGSSFQFIADEIAYYPQCFDNSLKNCDCARTTIVRTCFPLIGWSQQGRNQAAGNMYWVAEEHQLQALAQASNVKENTVLPQCPMYCRAWKTNSPLRRVSEPLGSSWWNSAELGAGVRTGWWPWLLFW